MTGNGDLNYTRKMMYRTADLAVLVRKDTFHRRARWFWGSMLVLCGVNLVLAVIGFWWPPASRVVLGSLAGFVVMVVGMTLLSVRHRSRCPILRFEKQHAEFQSQMGKIRNVPGE